MSQLQLLLEAKAADDAAQDARLLLAVNHAHADKDSASAYLKALQRAAAE